MASESIRSKGAGSIVLKNGHHHVRVSLPDGTRPWYTLCHIKRTGVCTCRKLTPAKLAETAAHVAERERERVALELADEERAIKERRLTVRVFGEKWTSGALYDKHGDVNGLRPKASAKNDAYRLEAYVYPEIGNMPVADVTEQDIEIVLQKAEVKARKKLGRAWRKSSRFQVYQVMRRLFDLAIRPGRLRSDNPVSTYLRPGRDDPKLYGFLYPNEVLALLGCQQVPIGRRVLYALAAFTGLRKGSLYALKWSGVDFHHRTLTSLHSKTGLPQLFEVHESLMELLQAWHRHRGKPSDDSPIVPKVPTRHREARILRDDLEAAGIKRATLFGGADNVQQVRFHDLRATFVTWAMREGRGDGWISDRTGHLTPTMRARYARAARTLADLDYQPFPNVAEAIPELKDKPANVVPFKRSGE